MVAHLIAPYVFSSPKLNQPKTFNQNTAFKRYYLSYDTYNQRPYTCTQALILYVVLLPVNLVDAFLPEWCKFLLAPAYVAFLFNKTNLAHELRMRATAKAFLKSIKLSPDSQFGRFFINPPLAAKDLLVNLFKRIQNFWKKLSHRS